MKTQWRKIHLLGGKPMISNSFGKRVPFVLEPSGLNTPDDYDDNYICGTCVRDNETALRWKGSSRMVHSTVTQQEAINQGEEPLHSMSWLTCFASFLCEFSSWLYNAMYFKYFATEKTQVTCCGLCRFLFPQYSLYLHCSVLLMRWLKLVNFTVWSNTSYSLQPLESLLKLN